jgi:hypothetical protein
VPEEGLVQRYVASLLGKAHHLLNFQKK